VQKVTGFKDGQSARIETALRYWDFKRGTRLMPARRDIRLHEVPAALPMMMLLDVQPKPLDFRVRFIGVGLKLRLGTDLTGRSITTIPAMRPETRAWATYETAVRERRAQFIEVPFMGPDKAMRIAQDMIAPLADDGETVDGIFAVLDWTPATGISQNVA
jgi:hypothetical protein